MKKTVYLLALTALVASCAPEKKPEMALLNAKDFEATVDGKEIELFTIKNNDIAAQVTNFGARIVSLFALDKDGEYQDVVWGYESIDAYLKATDKYSGPVVGRFGNRIGKGQFTLDGREYQLSINDGENHLHGGAGGFSTKIWDAKQLNDSTVTMSYFSADGEEGYPGNLTITLTYTATADCALKLTYSATTDQTTIINPTSHAYFNLNGTSDNAMEHTLMIAADSFTPTDKGLIPTGEIRSVAGTPLDFRAATTIGERIESDYEPIVFGGGYDHNWIFSKQSLEHPQVRLYSAKSGIEMIMYTDQPAVQFYSGNFMDGIDTGKRGDKHNYRTGVALEAQNYPDAPNHDNFPSSVLKIGETYTQTTIYKFSIRK